MGQGAMPGLNILAVHTDRIHGALGRRLAAHLSGFWLAARCLKGDGCLADQ